MASPRGLGLSPVSRPGGGNTGDALVNRCLALPVGFGVSVLLASELTFLPSASILEYSMPQGGKTSRSRERLGKLVREGGEVLTVEQATRILGGDAGDVAKTLARWCNQGWLSRIKRGVYIPAPVEAISTDRAVEDAWVLVPELFGPAYLGGWSAAEHWDLTEQIFRDI